MFRWKKHGKIFDPTELELHDWMQEQAQNPYIVRKENCIRVYFNCRAKRDEKGISTSYGGFIDIDYNDFFKVIKVSDKPVLNLGKKGDFDEFGVMTGSVFPVGDKFYLYYCGWTRMISVPYNWSIGLGISDDGGDTFKRFGMGPIIGSTPFEPFLQAGCSSIIKEGDIYHLWYTSGIKWIDTDSKPESVYQIMHATSYDAINWTREARPIINSVISDEAQASPSVIKIGNKWHMVFSYRHSVNFRNKDRGYRLGYAWSENMHTWHRDDKILNFDVSSSGWDSEMVCYPHICEINGKIYIFYCGNDFGRKGFGFAELVEH